MSTQELAIALGEHPLQSVNIGRYILHRQIARGGMATIHIARLMGDEGFSRIVSAKRLLPEFAQDSEFVAMFLDEARIASKVHHRNVVPVLDVVTAMDEVVLVQEYVHGAPLNWLLNKARQAHDHVPVDIAVSIATQVLAGLHAAHELVDELGVKLDVVHRDVSPQNIMVDTGGTARLLDFGVAKATMAAHVTREGTYKGKLAYSAPEQLRGYATRQSDIYSLGVVLWELLVGHRMHGSQGEAELVAQIMNGALPTITETLAAEHEWSTIEEAHWQALAALEPIVKRGLAVNVADRWATAYEMEEALIAVIRPASGTAVAAWLKSVGKDYLEKHDKVLAAEEASWRKTERGQSSIRRASTAPLESRRMAKEEWGESKVHPPAPPRRAAHAMVLLLSTLVILLAFGMMLIVRGPTAQSQAATTPQAAPAPSITPPPSIAPPPQELARPVLATQAPANAEAATPVPESIMPAPELDSISIGRVETRSIGAAPVVVRRAPVRSAPPARQPPPPPPRQVRKATLDRLPDDPKPAQPVVSDTPPPQQQPATTSCNPPYYFEGVKKIFKPSCL